MLVCGWAFSYQVSLPCNQLLVWIQETFLFLKLDLKLYFLIKLIFRLTSVETVLSYPALGSVHWGGCSIMLWAFLLHFSSPHVFGGFCAISLLSSIVCILSWFLFPVLFFFSLSHHPLIGHCLSLVQLEVVRGLPFSLHQGFAHLHIASLLFFFLKYGFHLTQTPSGNCCC